MKRSAFVFVPLLFLALALLPGCSRLRQPLAVVERVAEEARQRQTVFSLTDLKADCEKPPGAAEILITHLVANSKDGADQELALFNAALCQDLALRVTRLPEVRGQVPGWVVQKVMGQLNLRTMTLTPESAIKVARLAGRRHALTGAIERQGDKLQARVEIWDAKAGKRVGDAIELSGLPQDLLARGGWLAEQIAGRIGVRLTAADRAWLDRPQFHDVKDAIEIGQLMRHEGKDHTTKLAARREREPRSLLVELEWFDCRPFKDADEYAAALQAAHKRFPEEPQFLEWMFQEHLRTADKAGAKRALDDYLRLHPGSWQGLNMRGRYYDYLESDCAASLRATESMAVLYPDCWLSWFRCGHEALNWAYDARAGHYFGEMNEAQRRVFARGVHESLAAGERGLALNERDPELLTEMIGVYRENSMPKRAEEVFAKAIAIDPGNISAYSELAWLYKRGYENDEKRRTEILKQALSIPARTWPALQAQAGIAFTLKEKDRAMELYRKAIAAAGDAVAPDLHLCYAWAVADNLGRYDEAEKHVRIALRQNVTPDGYMSLAQFLTHQQRFDEALAAVQEAKRLDPHNPECDATLALVQYKMGAKDKALINLAKAHEREPREVQYTAAIMGAYLSRGDYDRAWEWMQKVKQSPEWEKAEIELLDAADIHALKGQYRDAIRYYDMNLQKKPGHVKSLTRGALCYMALEDFKRAAQRWQKVLDEHPDHAESHMGLAVALDMQGRHEEARAQARKAVAADARAADPKYLAKELYWPQPLADAAGQLAAAGK